MEFPSYEGEALAGGVGVPPEVAALGGRRSYPKKPKKTPSIREVKEVREVRDDKGPCSLIFKNVGTAFRLSGFSLRTG